MPNARTKRLAEEARKREEQEAALAELRSKIDPLIDLDLSEELAGALVEELSEETLERLKEELSGG